MSEAKVILVIGATGAQGIAVIDAILAPHSNGQPSPYSVRALTRDPTSKRAEGLKAKGVQLVKGSTNDLASVGEALQGAYGAWVNTDSFTIGEAREIITGIRIYELAKRAGTVRHFIWSSLDYVGKLTNYDPSYAAEHYGGKALVGEFLKAQESRIDNEGMTWTSVLTGPYMDTLNTVVFGPVGRRADGTFIFASPVGDGHVPMVALRDVGFFARYAFDNRALVSARELAIASEMVHLGGPGGLVDTFTKVTGQPAVYVRQTIVEWMGNLVNPDIPVASDVPDGTTWRENFSRWWRLYRDDIIQRDMKWIRSVNPGGYTLESWMRDNKYDGQPRALLKGLEGQGGLALGIKAGVVDKL